MNTMIDIFLISLFLKGLVTRLRKNSFAYPIDDSLSELQRGFTYGKYSRLFPSIIFGQILFLNYVLLVVLVGRSYGLSVGIDKYSEYFRTLALQYSILRLLVCSILVTVLFVYNELYYGGVVVSPRVIADGDVKIGIVDTTKATYIHIFTWIVLLLVLPIFRK